MKRYLHFNELVDFDSETFTNLPSLERLFLHNNKLQRIPSGAFKNMESLKRLRLDSNALVCDCEMVWLVKMLQAKQKTTQAAATCQYPIAMQGKSLASMSEHDFHCSQYTALHQLSLQLTQI
uniref:LRRCT domain-containing protein n=1 Tax=Timema shepardi TaxID=629360 RepID=A0A7R9AYZ3_TIMSH|nr:unnamed protein product [Timema shepardi]